MGGRWLWEEWGLFLKYTVFMSEIFIIHKKKKLSTLWSVIILLNIIQDSGIQNFKNDLNLAFCIKHNLRKFIKAYHRHTLRLKNKE